MNVSIPRDLKQWIDEQVKTGGYGTPSEYLSEMLRRARERQIRRAIDTGLVQAIAEGPQVTMDERDWAAIRKAARAEVANVKRKQ
jgi:antitoxin ParD1/3/4